MQPDPNESLERYPLRSLVTTLRTYNPPSGPFDPAGSWDQTWGVCTLAGRTEGARPVGSLALRRRVGGKDATLQVAYDKMLSGGRQKIAATLHGRAGDPLAKPVVAIAMGDPAGIGAEVVVKALADPQLRRQGRFIIYGLHELIGYAADLAEINPYWWRQPHETVRRILHQRGLRHLTGRTWCESNDPDFEAKKGR